MGTDAATWTCQALDRPIEATVRVPGSKSLTNRALVLAALAGGPCRLTGVLFADDTRHMLDNLARLGLKLDIDEPAQIVTINAPGSGDFATVDAELFCGNSGTTIRFLSALLVAIGEARFELTGNDRMRQRPIGPLADLLNAVAGRVAVDVADNGCPPVSIDTTSAGGLVGGPISYAAQKTLSSQYLSAALMIAPYTKRELHLDLGGPQVSWPYVKMTMRLMDVFGITPEVELDDHDEQPTAVIVPSGRYAGTDYAIEPDASAASYFQALAAVHAGSRVTISGLGTESLQGDAAFASLLKRMKCDVQQTTDRTVVTGPNQLVGIEADLSLMPDCAQTLAVVALFASGPTTMHGLKTLRVKETDRVAALQAELAKLGGDTSVTERDGDVSMTIVPPPRIRRASIATYDDHRMAMSFAIAATRRDGIVIEEPSCVSKTYPEFFDVLEQVMDQRAR